MKRKKCVRCGTCCFDAPCTEAMKRGVMDAPCTFAWHDGFVAHCVLLDSGDVSSSELAIGEGCTYFLSLCPRYKHLLGDKFKAAKEYYRGQNKVPS